MEHPPNSPNTVFSDVRLDLHNNIFDSDAVVRGGLFFTARWDKYFNRKGPNLWKQQNCLSSLSSYIIRIWMNVVSQTYSFYFSRHWFWCTKRTANFYLTSRDDLRHLCTGNYFATVPTKTVKAFQYPQFSLNYHICLDSVILREFLPILSSYHIIIVHSEI